MIKISLWENAYESIEHGLEHLEDAIKNNNPYDYKRVVLDFCHATELLLKEILYRIDPIYIFDKNDIQKNCKDPLAPTIEELYICRSLQVNPLCKAIKRHAPDFDGKLKIFSKEASQLRNKIQHFCYQSTVSEVRSILLRLSYQLLCTAFHYLNTNKKYEPLESRLHEAFSIETVVSFHEDIYKKENRNYTIGTCHSCGCESLVITFGDSDVPTQCECLACTFAIDNINPEDYHICPECDATALVYSEELYGGICLWYKCANHRDGGIIVDMEICDTCDEYRIEDRCDCTENDIEDQRA